MGIAAYHYYAIGPNGRTDENRFYMHGNRNTLGSIYRDCNDLGSICLPHGAVTVTQRLIDEQLFFVQLARVPSIFKRCTYHA